MNKRIVLIDSNETPNYAYYFGCGLGKNVYLMQTLETMDPGEVDKLLGHLGPGDAVMTVGGIPFKFIKDRYHLGIRGENYFDCAKLWRLSMEGGAFLKEIDNDDLPGIDIIQDFLSPEFTRPVVFPEFKSDLVSTYERALRFISYMDTYPGDQNFGFDYEASGMPMDKVFWVSGFSLVTERIGAFVSLTDIRRELKNDPEGEYKYKNLLKIIGDFLVKRMSHIWTYNMQYEWLVSHRLLGVDLYNLCDASAVNTMDGYHMKKYSLKWTAQRVLHATVWDSEFERISDTIDSMYFREEGKLKRDKHKVIKVTPEDFESTPEWQELKAKYPEDIDEMKSLVLEYWGFPFMVPSSRLLGYYCCLDSFYTLMIAESRFNTYNSDCWNVNLDNIRLGARLMGSGLYIDEPYRIKYREYCQDQQTWAITYCAQARCFVKMMKHKNLACDINKFPEVSQKLIKRGEFYGGDVESIVKNILLTHIDTLDTYPTGLDEGALLMDYGPEFANFFVGAVKTRMTELKIKVKLDETVKRKKKLISLLASDVKPVLGNAKMKKDQLVELEKYMYYKRAYDELGKVCKNQLTDIYNIPKTIYIFGKVFTRSEYSEYISNNYFKCKSPVENDQIALEFTELFKPQTAYLTALLESSQQLPETTHFYDSRGITDVNTGYSEFMEHWEKYVTKGEKSNLYPDKIFDLALLYYQNPQEDKAKETWTNMNGFLSQSQFFPGVKDEYERYEEHFKETDIQNDFYFMRKTVLNYLVYKKYAKLESTYVGDSGMFHKTGKWVIEGQDHIPLREANPKEPGAVWKVFVHYEVMTKSSKRWSSPFHTIISHGDCKDCIIGGAPIKDKDGNIIYNGSDQVLTYFDINYN